MKTKIVKIRKKGGGEITVSQYKKRKYRYKYIVPRQNSVYFIPR